MPLHAPPDYRCPFCAYVRGEDDDYVGPEHVVERTPHTLTYVSPRWWPNNPGAVLVIPTEHYENLYELPDWFGLPIQRAARRAAQAMKLAYSCAGVSTRQHNEPAGNQDVWHFHVHVFPRFPDDELYRSRGAWAARPDMTERAEQLRTAFGQLAPDDSRPTVVCLCGSTRFRDEFARAQRHEAFAGRIVLGPGVFSQSDGTELDAEEIARLNAVHLAKIEMADEILVIDPGGYVGETTRAEIHFALSLGRRVRFASEEQVVQQ